jgi:hypothetical protein
MLCRHALLSMQPKAYRGNLERIQDERRLDCQMVGLPGAGLIALTLARQY